jgi:hypothetical protein
MLFSTVCFAGGTYQVTKDGGAYYFETDNDGAWGIDKSDLKNFKLGQSGTYSTGRDKNGTFIFTDTKQKIYVDIRGAEIQRSQAERENQEYERKEALRQQRMAKEEQQNAVLKAQERKDRADRKIEEQKLEQKNEMDKKILKALNRPVNVYVH